MISTSQRRLIVEAAQNGATTAELCERFGASRHAIGRVIRPHGVKARESRGRYPRGFTTEPRLRSTVHAILDLFGDEGDGSELIAAQMIAASNLMRQMITAGTEPVAAQRDPLSWMLWRRLAFHTGNDKTFRPYSWTRIAWDAGLPLLQIEEMARRLRRALQRYPEAAPLLRLAYPPERAVLREESWEGEAFQEHGAAGRVVAWERHLWRVVSEWRGQS